jgi:hypothetical protein
MVLVVLNVVEGFIYVGVAGGGRSLSFIFEL